jgi:hypothetical protein
MFGICCALLSMAGNALMEWRNARLREASA